MTNRRIQSLLLAAVLTLPALAEAALKDLGPVNPTTGFPTWYRDTTNVALQLCLDQRASPNPAAGGLPMCLPIVTDPSGYAGNLGGENFWFMSTASITGAGGFSLLWEAAMEATYATGIPIRGDEISFARLRIVIDSGKVGNYRVIHPYGVETFIDVGAGKRAVTFTVDIGATSPDFTGALGGGVGPFMQWDVLAPGESLTLPNPDGTVQEFLGDPNYPHTATGSPFGTNFVRVEGPPGSNLDGLGNDFIQTNLFTILGQKYMTAIPIPLEICRATYAIDAATGITQVDVFAEATPASQLIFTADGVPTTPIAVDSVTGNGIGSVAYQNVGPVPGQVTVTNLADNPHSKYVGPLTDMVTTGPGVFFPDISGATAGTVSVIVETSVRTATPPTLGILELPGATQTIADPARPWVVQFDATIPLGSTPPWDLTAQSAAGGVHVEPVIFGANPVDTSIRPVAVPQALVTQRATPTAPFSALDVNFPAATAMILNPPGGGTAVVDALGNITYTPNPVFFGAIDSFTYILFDSISGKYSNAALVTVDVGFVNSVPVAGNDSGSTSVGTAVTINVLVNDSDADGNMVPGSVTVVGAPLFGTALANGDGTVTYTPSATFVGTDTFLYTVADAAGGVSLPATVTITVFSAQERLTFTSAEWVTGKDRLRANGTSSIFGPGILNTVSLYIGCAEPGVCNPVLLGRFIGSSPIDALGGWAVDVTNPGIILDASGCYTAISTGGGIKSQVVRVK